MRTLPAIAMRHIITTLILLIGLLSCKEKVGQTDSPETRIENQFKNLTKTKEIKFGGGDVWGTTYIFNNADSSVTKILVDYDAGDYGKGINEYIIVDNKLVYQRDSTLAGVINKSPLDSNEYKLHEVTSYFNNDSTGIKTSRAVYSKTFDFDDKKIKELKNKKTDSLTLTRADYLKMLAELKDALTKTVIED
jgi:hypothetical protein